MSWLSSHLKIPSGGLKGITSNLLKNAAPLAFLVPGVGPGLAAAIGGAGSALGQGLSRHPSLGGALKSGITGAAEAYGGAKLGPLGNIGRGGGLASATTSGSPINAGATSVSQITGNAPTSLFGSAGNLGGPGVSSSGLGGMLGGGAPVGGGVGLSPSALNFAPESNALLAGAPGITPHPLSTPMPSHSGGTLGRIAGFAKDNPLVAGKAFDAVGGLATSGSENRLRDAQANALEQQAGETAYDFQARKRRESLLAPIWSALGAGVGREPNVAPNPYAHPGTP